MERAEHITQQSFRPKKGNVVALEAHGHPKPVHLEEG
jgi:hypothetical protein